MLTIVHLDGVEAGSTTCKLAQQHAAKKQPSFTKNASKSAVQSSAVAPNLNSNSEHDDAVRELTASPRCVCYVSIPLLGTGAFVRRVRSGIFREKQCDAIGRSHCRSCDLRRGTLRHHKLHVVRPQHSSTAMYHNFVCSSDVVSRKTQTSQSKTFSRNCINLQFPREVPRDYFRGMFCFFRVP